jgi:PPOX class probable F420-dependent enzyme
LTTQNHNPKIPENYQELLESTALAHVGTIGPGGEPQNNPVWFDWDGEHVKFSQTKARQKFRNLKRDPRVAFSIVDPENSYRYHQPGGERVVIFVEPGHTTQMGA